MAEQERLTLVTDFATLKPGDLVVVTPCSRCKGRHRHLLLNHCHDEHRRHGAFVVDPQPPCGGGPCGALVTRIASEHGCLYLVDTGLEQSQDHTETTTRPKETVDG